VDGQTAPLKRWQSHIFTGQDLGADIGFKLHAFAKPASSVSRTDVAGRLDLTNVFAMPRRDTSCIPQIDTDTTNARESRSTHHLDR